MITQKKLVADYLQSQGYGEIDESHVNNVTHSMVGGVVVYEAKVDAPHISQYLHVDSLELMCFLYSKINEAKNPWSNASREKYEKQMSCGASHDEYKKQLLGDFKPDANAQFLEKAWLDYYRKIENMDSYQARLELGKLHDMLAVFPQTEIDKARCNVKQRGLR